MPFTEALKLRVRRKAHFLCCLCKSIGVEVHHIIPQEEGGPDTEENAAPLCPTCHETYGANPTKRKFIREARDLWYEVCERRYASDASKLDELAELMKNTITYEDFELLKTELIEAVRAPTSTPRSEGEIDDALGKLLDLVWHNRHLYLKEQIRLGRETVDPEIWKGALRSAKRVRDKYPKGELGPYSEFDWGMINGKLSALRWVLGEDWDVLDT